MVKLAVLVLLLMFTAAFAAPTFPPITNDLQPGPSSVLVSEIHESGTMVEITDAAVVGEIDREKETGLSIEELTDDMKAAKELSELDFFRFYSHNTRMDQILESYLVASSQQTEKLGKWLTPEIIHQAIEEYRQNILDEWETDGDNEWDIYDDLNESDRMAAYLSARIPIEKAQIKLDLHAAWSQTNLEAMDKIQYRGNDDIMDFFLKKKIGYELETKFNGLNIQQIRRPNPGSSLATGDELLIDHMSKEFGFEERKTRQLIQRARQKMLKKVDGDGNDDIMNLLIEIGNELQTKFARLNIQQIRRPNPGCSLAMGDELLIDHMSKEFGFEERKTRQLIQRARQKMLKKVDGEPLGLDGYSDDVAMDERIVSLLENESAFQLEALDIFLDVGEFRITLNREKKTLDAEQLKAYDDDQKMFELLEGKYFIRSTVEEARWQNTFFLAVRYRKTFALRYLMGSGGSYSKDVVESTINNLASNSKDQVDIAMLETLLFKYSGLDSRSISLGRALTKAEEKSNILVLISLLKLEGATHPMKDELALLIENHPAVKEFRESIRIIEPLIEVVPASAEHTKSSKMGSEGDVSNFSKVVIESTIEILASNSKDQVDVAVLESLFNHPGFGSPNIGLGRALTKAEETSNILVLTFLLKLEGATHPTKDGLASLVENHPAVKAFKESVRISK